MKGQTRTRKLFSLFSSILVLVLSTSAQAGLLSGNQTKPDGSSSGKSTNSEKHDSGAELDKKSDAEIVEELKGYSDTFPTFEQAGRVVKIAEQYDSIAIQEPLFKAAGMAYASLGRMKPYKRFRNRIGILANFESGVIVTCRKCNGSGTNKETGNSLCETCGGSGLVAPDRNLAKKRAREWLEKGIHQIEYRIERDRKEEAEAQRREEERKRAEAFAAEQRAKGLVLYNGRWMTPAQRDEAAKYERFRSFIMKRSKASVSFRVFQIIGDGQALCTNEDTGEDFCLLFATDSAKNRAIVEDQRFTNDLFWAGTYSYTTVRNVPRKIAKFAIDYSTAVEAALRQGFLED